MRRREDQSPGQVNWWVPIRVPAVKVPLVASGDVRLELDGGDYAAATSNGYCVIRKCYVCAGSTC